MKRGGTESPEPVSPPRSAADAAYDNLAAVPDGARRVASWAERSARLRGDHRKRVELRYGARDREKIDVFLPPGRPRGVLAFVHGGYWIRNDKASFSFVGGGALARGWAFAAIGYTLAPALDLRAIAREVREAVAWIAAYPPLKSGPLALSGWSAGAHLAALAWRGAEVSAGIGVSGIYDLEPLRETSVGRVLRLDMTTARRASPILRPPPLGRPIVVARGTRELPAVRDQSLRLSQTWRARGASIRDVELPADHFTILEELAEPDGALARELDGLVAPPAPDRRP